MSYPVTHLALTGEDADALRRLHASSADAAVLARVRDLAAGPADRLSGDPAWELVRRCLAWSGLISSGESVFGRRDYTIELLGAEEVAAAAAALAGVSSAWLRDRFDRLWFPAEPGQPGGRGDFAEVWAGLARLAGLFDRASRAEHCVLVYAASRFWRPPRLETGPDGRPRVVRPAYRPEDYTVDPNAVRSLPADGGSWPFEAELSERDGALYNWTEVERFIRGGRTWVRMTNSTAEYYIDVENADDRIGRIECVDPLIAYWLARRSDKYPVVLED